MQQVITLDSQQIMIFSLSLTQGLIVTANVDEILIYLEGYKDSEIGEVNFQDLNKFFYLFRDVLITVFNQLLGEGF